MSKDLSKSLYGELFREKFCEFERQKATEICIWKKLQMTSWIWIQCWRKPATIKEVGVLPESKSDLMEWEPIWLNRGIKHF